MKKKFKICLLNDKSIKWLYKKNYDCLKHYTENTDVEKERDNIKNVLQKTAEESLGKIQVTKGETYRFGMTLKK